MTTALTKKDTTLVTPKERPVPFTSEMINAILSGQKTMTRRVIKKQPQQGENVFEWQGYFYNCETDDPRLTANEKGEFQLYPCKYGIVGDRLWVRETHYALRHDISHVFDPNSHKMDKEFNHYSVYYKADSKKSPVLSDSWKPSMFMPRFASRILLEINDIKAERVQDISEADAIREGVASVAEFRTLWDSINGKTPGKDWASNPFVFAIGFKRIEG
jgi:hypothetical protein